MWLRALFRVSMRFWGDAPVNPCKEQGARLSGMASSLSTCVFRNSMVEVSGMGMFLACVWTEQLNIGFDQGMDWVWNRRAFSI